MPNNPSWAVRLFLDNKGAKILAFVVACVSWYAIQEIISFEKPLADIPIDVEVEEEGWAVLEKSPQTVSVIFRGPEETIWDMDRKNIRVRLKIKASEAQEVELVPIQLNTIATPRGVRAVMVDPGYVRLRLDQEGQTNVPVKATTINELPQGFEVEELICKPATVNLYGPRQRLDSTDILRTHAIDLESRFQTFTKRVTVAPPSESWGARVEPDVVEVTVKIVERSATREVKGVAVKAMLGGDIPESIQLFPAKVDLVLEGRSETLESFDPSTIQAYVDCSGLAAGATYDLPIKAQLGQGLHVQSMLPRTVEVRLQ